jgi:D-alanyl-D-alanine dipeptidase
VDFQTRKPGVAQRSWHKAGRAIDVTTSYNVGGRQGVVFVRDPNARRLYRVYIRCARQDGLLGVLYGPKQLGGKSGYYVDVTAILESEGFQRIPPNGKVSEAWHYEFRGGVSWATAMQELYSVRTLRKLFPGVWR